MRRVTGTRRARLRLKATDPNRRRKAAKAVRLDEKSLDEKKGTPEVDAVDADNLAGILNQLGPALPPKEPNSRAAAKFRRSSDLGPPRWSLPQITAGFDVRREPAC